MSEIELNQLSAQLISPVQLYNNHSTANNQDGELVVGQGRIGAHLLLGY